MSTTTTGPPIRNVGPTQLNSNSEYRPTMLGTPDSNEAPFDPGCRPCHVVYLGVEGTVRQQPLAEKPAGLSLKRYRIDEQPQGIAEAGEETHSVIRSPEAPPPRA